MEKTSFLKEPVGGQSVVNKIVDNITNAIINGELNPGDKIPTEAELSESMGAGRNSVPGSHQGVRGIWCGTYQAGGGHLCGVRNNDSRMIYPVLLRYHTAEGFHQRAENKTRHIVGHHVIHDRAG